MSSLSSHMLNRIYCSLISKFLNWHLEHSSTFYNLACWETLHQIYLISVAVMVPIGNYQAGIRAFIPVSWASFRWVKPQATHPFLRRHWQISKVIRLKFTFRNAASSCMSCYLPIRLPREPADRPDPKLTFHSLCPPLNFQIYFCKYFQIFLPM